MGAGIAGIAGMGIAGMGIAGMGIAGMGKKNCEYELSTHTRVLPALSVLVPVLAIVIPLPVIYWVSTRDRHCISGYTYINKKNRPEPESNFDSIEMLWTPKKCLLNIAKQLEFCKVIKVFLFYLFIYSKPAQSRQNLCLLNLQCIYTMCIYIFGDFL